MLGELHGLETLDLEDNELGAEDGRLGPSGQTLTSLSRLQCLNVAQCRLTHLPLIVERLSGLRILDLTNNRSANISTSSARPVMSTVPAPWLPVKFPRYPQSFYWLAQPG